ncbi:hypothetical protein [Streptomyces niveus]|uniref:hypothetical protein n=1 Tax=Streptomyces niveus TaxID=193462 RepID=UPI001F4080A3|nr:hypothetical protein [Streptomyces niveus]
MRCPARRYAAAGVRNYGIGVVKTAERLGEALELLWGTAAVNTRNSCRAGVLSWLGRCRERGYEGPMVPAWAKRLAVPDSEIPARSKMGVDRLIARREVRLWEKTLWWMLYEPPGGSGEILGVDIEELDLAGRPCLVKAEDARTKARRRGQSREDYVPEPVYGGADTWPARLSYEQARALLDEHTACWGLHEYRYSALPHLGGRRR